MASLNFPSIALRPQGKPKYRPGKGYVEDDNDHGFLRRRAVTTRTQDVLEIPPLVMTNAEADSLMTFYRSDTSNGSKIFNFTSPWDGNTYEVRFVDPPVDQNETDDLRIVTFSLVLL